MFSTILAYFGDHGDGVMTQRANRASNTTQLYSVTPFASTVLPCMMDPCSVNRSCLHWQDLSPTKPTGSHAQQSVQPIATSHALCCMCVCASRDSRPLLAILHCNVYVYICMVYVSLYVPKSV